MATHAQAAPPAYTAAAGETGASPARDKRKLPCLFPLCPYKCITLCKSNQHPFPRLLWVFQESTPAFSWFPDKEEVMGTQEHI